METDEAVGEAEDFEGRDDFEEENVYETKDEFEAEEAEDFEVEGDYEEEGGYEAVEASEDEVPEWAGEAEGATGRVAAGSDRSGRSWRVETLGAGHQEWARGPGDDAETAGILSRRCAQGGNRPRASERQLAVRPSLERGVHLLRDAHRRSRGRRLRLRLGAHQVCLRRKAGPGSGDPREVLGLSHRPGLVPRWATWSARTARSRNAVPGPRTPACARAASLIATSWSRSTSPVTGSVRLEAMSINLSKTRRSSYGAADPARESQGRMPLARRAEAARSERRSGGVRSRPGRRPGQAAGPAGRRGAPGCRRPAGGIRPHERSAGREDPNQHGVLRSASGASGRLQDRSERVPSGAGVGEDAGCR